MTIIKATVNTQNQLKVKRVDGQEDLRLRSAIASREINTMDDIDVTTLTDGSVLVYKQETSKWTSTTLLNKQTVDAGEF